MSSPVLASLHPIPVPEVPDRVRVDSFDQATSKQAAKSKVGHNHKS